jgi:pimeloyl-ACP methyl ester carboxylesterase/DNA-binding CsgD family transcriptional regulator
VNQEIRFCSTPGGRVAYATAGSGPPLVWPAPWVSHVELEWGFPEFRAFVTGLARTHTVIRYDRLGTGLSDRHGAADDLITLEALVDALGLDAPSLLGISFGACTALRFAARRPVGSLALFGGFAYGEEIAPVALREAMVATVRAHWGAGARMLSDVWLPGASAALRERFARLQRAAASAETAAATLEAIYATDIRDGLGEVSAAALVLHRRNDRAIPFALARDLAARLPNARLVALEGEMHLPWLGATAPVLAALRGDEPVVSAGSLSAREREVLRLVGAGLSEAEIAAQLVLSPHTVHRHVANIRTKLGQPSRAAAVAYAARAGLI